MQTIVVSLTQLQAGTVLAAVKQSILVHALVFWSIARVVMVLFAGTGSVFVKACCIDDNALVRKSRFTVTVRDVVTQEQYKHANGHVWNGCSLENCSSFLRYDLWRNGQTNTSSHFICSKYCVRPYRLNVIFCATDGFTALQTVWLTLLKFSFYFICDRSLYLVLNSMLLAVDWQQVQDHKSVSHERSQCCSSCFCWFSFLYCGELIYVGGRQCAVKLNVPI